MSLLPELSWVPALSEPTLLAEPVAKALAGWELADQVEVAAIDPDLADTQARSDAYGLPLSASANCVIVTGRRAGDSRTAACVVLATTRADVNNLVRKQLDVRKASFMSTDEAVAGSAMEYGGITPVGLPADWQVLVDEAVALSDQVIIGSGIRGSKLRLPGSAVGRLPGAQVVPGLGPPVGG
jgi:prolyl-tRNA editing enzyme YbaK/EbsC (Cys-tRNA(Pro) deacylase)